MKQAYIPKGCDQQGRHPEAAEAATELGANQDDKPGPWWDAMLTDICIFIVLGAIILAIAL